jgi:phenylpropionate dioxygenase-like ring-hydroxylating dioxygenase large terminal subunit
MPETDLRKLGIHPDHWYPLARSKDLARGKTLGVRFAGDPIVLVRTESGSAFALENRCAHRQVPLCAGTVQGERLQCCYHGWSYDAAGRCKIPYRADAERPRGVRSYPCREAYGFVFVFPGEAARAEQVPFPDVPTYADSRYKTHVLDAEVECHYTFFHENLMDMNHQHLHRGLMGMVKAILLDTRQGEGWIEVDYTFERTAGKQNLGEKLILGKPKPPANGAKPKDVMTIRTGYPYQTLQVTTGGGTEPVLDLWNAYVPLSADQGVSRQLGLLMIRKPGFPGLIHLAWPLIVRFTEGIFAEDRWIMEEEQKAYEAQGADWNREVSAPILALREVLRASGLPLGTAAAPRTPRSLGLVPSETP